MVNFKLEILRKGRAQPTRNIALAFAWKTWVKSWIRDVFIPVLVESQTRHFPSAVQKSYHHASESLQYKSSNVKNYLILYKSKYFSRFDKRKELITAVPLQNITSDLGGGSITPFILKINTRWRCAVSFEPWSLHPRKIFPVLLSTRLDGSQRRSGRFGKEKNFLLLPEFELPTVQSAASRYID
jgi:hypothetical protein